MLVWVGKRPLTNVAAFPAQHIEQFSAIDPPDTVQAWDGWPSAYPTGGLLFHGDNKEVLGHLLANGFRGKVNLIYIDPPFDSGADYVRKVSLRGATGSAKLDGERYTLGEQIQYTDIWANDNYLQFMYERLLLLKELLTEDGSIYLHCDWHKSHMLRSVMDEVFGADNCVNEIVWKRTSGRSDSHTFNHIHDTILFYRKGGSIRFNELFDEHEENYVERYFTYSDPNGRRFATIDATQAGLRSGPSGQPWRGFDPSSKGNHWKFSPTDLDRLDAEGRVYWPLKEGGWPRLKAYLDEAKGRAIQSIWSDIKAVNSQAEERGDYPTQKPEALLERILQASSNLGDLVLDCFLGSGTTAAVAQNLGRRWIGCDINKGAIQTTAKRLQTIMLEQAEKISNEQAVATQGSLLSAVGNDAPDQDAAPGPAQLSFSVWRVNDYDLQIQHNEAVNLACEHLGVERTRADVFFDGTLGNHLVKIIPLDHALSPLDLDELQRELDSRPNEDREITLVCLGIEIAARAWLDDWNRLRKGKNAANRIHVIELRSDETYGSFFRHEPAQAKVRMARKDGLATIKIDDFVSPSIVERLRQQAGVLQPKIDDWRAMVDSVMIDASWNGQVFNVALSDIPERKSDLVKGSYEIAVAPARTTVAVKITDMLGEEVLVIAEV